MELIHDQDSFDSVYSTESIDSSGVYDAGGQLAPATMLASSVPLRNDSPIDSMTEVQKKKVARFYELLANAMPLEGRDYRVEFEPQSDGSSVMSRVVGLNAFGEAFSRQVSDFWRRFGI